MVLDAVSNFVRGTADAAVGTSDTTVSVADASIFPDPATDGEYNVVIWDVNNFPRPDQDGDVEIMRVTARDTTADELTVTRGQEMTSAAVHPEGSAIHLSPTAKMFSDIESTFGDFWDADNTNLTADVNNSNTTTQSLEAESATTDDLSATNGLVAGEEIGNDSQTDSPLSVDVDNWSDLKQIIIKVDRFRADGTDHEVQLIIDSDDSNSNYGYLNNDGSTAEDSVFRLFEASDDIIVGGTITITRIDGDESLVVNQLSGASTTSISRISTKANSGIYSDAIESGVAIDTDGEVNGSAEMTVFGVR